MSEVLKVSIIQSELVWQDAEQNRKNFEEKIKTIGNTDLIVLPEMFTTGFSMNAEVLAEVWENSETLAWLKQVAKQTQSAVCGSFIVKDQNNYYNRLVWTNPDGSIFTYDKRHLFRMANEHLHYSFGDKKLIIDYKGWKICPLICYDLRFPVWSRNVSEAYDVLIYVANWPARRRHAWDTLLRARAIENIAYGVGVNRVGTDGNNLYYSGNSVIIDYKGEELFYSKDEENIATVEFSKTELQEFRKTFPAHLDADSFSIAKL